MGSAASPTWRAGACLATWSAARSAVSPTSASPVPAHRATPTMTAATGCRALTRTTPMPALLAADVCTAPSARARARTIAAPPRATTASVSRASGRRARRGSTVWDFRKDPSPASGERVSARGNAVPMPTVPSPSNAAMAHAPVPPSAASIRIVCPPSNAAAGNASPVLADRAGKTATSARRITWTHLPLTS
jgi:hypothetical protein